MQTYEQFFEPLYLHVIQMVVSTVVIASALVQCMLGSSFPVDSSIPWSSLHDKASD